MQAVSEAAVSQRTYPEPMETQKTAADCGTQLQSQCQVELWHLLFLCLRMSLVRLPSSEDMEEMALEEELAERVVKSSGMHGYLVCTTAHKAD